MNKEKKRTGVPVREFLKRYKEERDRIEMILRF